MWQLDMPFSYHQTPNRDDYECFMHPKPKATMEEVVIFMENSLVLLNGEERNLESICTMVAIMERVGPKIQSFSHLMYLDRVGVFVFCFVFEKIHKLF